ncbi:MAG: 50S ribosomal protein L9 [Burkholderiales bacterium]|nr:50S ribosomal protein L9 [Anaerolineae bacterium]
MKVILLQDIYKQGVAGEIVEVADGYARNYLIPTSRALKATPQALKQAGRLREQAETRRLAYENKLNELARVIDGTELVFGRRAASTGKLFGSVTTAEIADALNAKTGVDINRRRISQTALREIGKHEVPVRLGTEIAPLLVITIVREDELADYLKSLEGQAAEDAPQNVVEAAGEAIAHAAEVVTGVVSNVAQAVAGVVENITGGSDESESEAAESSNE